METETDTFAGRMLAEGMQGLKFTGTVGAWRQGRYVWEDKELPTGGGNASMGDMEPTGDPSAVQFFAIPVTVWGDYVGGTVERSNWRSLQESFPDVFVDVVGGYWSHYLAIPAGYAGDEADEIVEMCTGLRDQYPVWDEEDESRLVDELAWEAWDEYLRMDLTRDLANAGVDVDAIEDDDLRQRFYGYEGDSYPYGETAVGVVFPDYDKTVAALVEHYGVAL